MNARFLARLFAYKNTPYALVSAQNILAAKVGRQCLLLRRYGLDVRAAIVEGDTPQSLMLSEARAARRYWRAFRTLAQEYPAFARAPHAPDIVNRLLDLGYHQLTNKVRAIFAQYHIPTEIGLLHEPHKSDSAPLAYDLVELFRADIVDAEVLRHLRLKKKSFSMLTSREIVRFLHNVNERMERRYYLKDFGACYAYRYYMELQILKFEKAVNHGELFKPMRLPVRHEGRCRRLDTKEAHASIANKGSLELDEKKERGTSALCDDFLNPPDFLVGPRISGLGRPYHRQPWPSAKVPPQRLVAAVLLRSPHHEGEGVDTSGR